MTQQTGKLPAWLFALPVVLAGAVYLNALNNPFIYDDFRLIVENTALTDPGNLRAVLLRDVTRPVVTLTYAADRAIWGPGPFGFHVTNVVLHMLAVGLFARLVWLLALDRRESRGGASTLDPAIFAATSSLLLAVHPVLTEAVGYISGRSELLCAVFLLASFLAVRRAMLARQPAWFAAAVALWLLALASKETAVVLPVLVLAYDWWLAPRNKSESGWRRLHIHLPLFGTAVLIAAARLVVFIAIEHGGDVHPQWSLAIVEIRVVVKYLSLFFNPSGQGIFHAIEPVGPLAGVLWTALLGAWAALAIRVRRAHPFVTVGTFWFLGALVPSAVLVVLDRGEPMAEHRLYLASLGIFLIAGVAISRFSVWMRSRGGSAIVPIGLVAAIALALAGRTVTRNRLWASPMLVWLESGERAPEHWFPALMLGEELHRLGRHEQAVAAFRRSIAARPEEPSAHGKLGVCLAETGDLEGAARAFAAQRNLDPNSPEASNGFAMLAFLRGDLATARQTYLRTIALDPDNLAARIGLLAIEEAPGGNPAEALRWCEDIRRLAPGSAADDECIRRNQGRPAGR